MGRIIHRCHLLKDHKMSNCRQIQKTVKCMGCNFTVLKGKPSFRRYEKFQQ